MNTPLPTNRPERKELIESLAHAELRSGMQQELCGIVCCLDDEVLILTGNVPTFYHKQIAQTRLIAKFEGLFPLENRLIVSYV
jgi:hypothetical protein